MEAREGEKGGSTGGEALRETWLNENEAVGVERNESGGAGRTRCSFPSLSSLLALVAPSLSLSSPPIKTPNTHLGLLVHLPDVLVLDTAGMRVVRGVFCGDEG